MKKTTSKKNTAHPPAGAYPVPVYRLQLVEDGTANVSPLTTPAEVAMHLGEIAAADREHMVALFLDTKNRPIGRHLVSVGTVNATPVQPRDVFRAALVAGAVNALILSYNHPSGDVTPSREDDESTRAIARSGKLLGISLLDHVILAPDGSHFSYRDRRPDCLEG